MTAEELPLFLPKSSFMAYADREYETDCDFLSFLLLSLLWCAAYLGAGLGAVRRQEKDCI